MGQNFPGPGTRTAPYQRTYTSFASDRDLTEEVTNAQRATSGLIVQAGAADNLVWQDCAGVQNTITFTAAFTGYLPISATVLEDGTDCISVTAVWV